VARYRTISYEVDAFQIRDGAIPFDLTEALGGSAIRRRDNGSLPPSYMVRSDQGDLTAQDGDWIVLDVRRALGRRVAVVNGEVFEKRYTPIADDLAVMRAVLTKCGIRLVGEIDDFVDCSCIWVDGAPDESAMVEDDVAHVCELRALLTEITGALGLTDADIAELAA
jgi:hypothetical protein